MEPAKLLEMITSTFPLLRRLGFLALRTTPVWAMPVPAPLPVSPFRLRLTNKSLLQLKGERRDLVDFLHGLLTCDVRRLRPEQPVWGCFLEFNGRVLADAYVYEQPPAPGGEASDRTTVWLEVEDGSHTEVVLGQLLEMRMRRKIHIENVSDRWSMVAAYHPTAPLLAAPHALATFCDPRSTALRDPAAPAPLPALSAPLSPPPPGPGPGPVTLWKQLVPREWAPDAAPLDPYHLLLATNGIGEGAAVFPTRRCTPFDGNADLLAGGICFDKGCYIGQELTHRTHVMLVVRKRLLPVAVAAPPSACLSGATLVTAAKERAGKIAGTPLPPPPPPGSYSSPVCAPLRGTAVVRLEHVSENTHRAEGLQLEGGEPVAAHIPHWWPPTEVKKMFRKLRRGSSSPPAP